MARHLPWLLVGSTCLLLAPGLAAKAPPSSQMGALPDGALAALGPPRLMHHARISSLAFSPDGRAVYASASLLRVQSSLGEQQAIRAWDVRTGKLLRQFGGPRWGFLALAISPDGRSLASVGGDGAVDVWDLATARQRGRLRAPLEGNCVSAVAYSPDGKMLAACGLDVRTWDTATGRLLQLFGQEGMYHALAFAPDRKSLVTTTYADTKISFWDSTTGKRLRRVEGPSSACPSFAASGLLALGGEEGEAQLWRPADGKPSRKLGGTSDEVLYGPCVVALSRDGKVLAWGAERGVIHLWDVARARERPPLPGHAKAVTALAFSPDGTTLASGGLDREVRLWDVATGRQRFAGPGHAEALTAMAFARAGTIATAGEDGSVRTWSPTGAQAHHFQGHKGPVSSVAFLGAGQRLVSGGDDGTIRFWDGARGKTPADLNVTQKVKVVSVSSDGNALAAGLLGGQARLWRLECGSFRALPKPAQGWDKGLALSPDGKEFATAGLAVGSKQGGTSVQLRHAKEGSLVRQFLFGNPNDFGPLAFSADGSRLAVVHQQDEEAPSIVLFRVQTGQELARLRGPARRIRAVAFSPDGRALAAGGADGVVHLWEVATGQELRRFEGHLDEITCVAFAPDGKALASGG